MPFIQNPLQEVCHALNVACVDLKDAFDSVSNEAFWKELRNVSMSEIVLKLIRVLYNNTIRQIHLGCNVSARVHATSVVKQAVYWIPLFSAVPWISSLYGSPQLKAQIFS